MDRTLTELGNEIRRIAGKSAMPQVYMGRVVAGSVDLGALTCKVVLSIDDVDVPTEGVLLNGLSGSDLGVVLLPADNSVVWVCEIDGPGKHGIIRASEVTKVLVKVGDVNAELSNGKVYFKQGAGEYTMSGGKFSIKNGSTDLKTVLNNILSHVQAITVPTGVGPSGVPINVADFVADNSLVNGLLF